MCRTPCPKPIKLFGVYLTDVCPICLDTNHTMEISAFICGHVIHSICYQTLNPIINIRSGTNNNPIHVNTPDNWEDAAEQEQNLWEVAPVAPPVTSWYSPDILSDNVQNLSGPHSDNNTTLYQNTNVIRDQMLTPLEEAVSTPTSITSGQLQCAGQQVLNELIYFGQRQNNNQEFCSWCRQPAVSVVYRVRIGRQYICRTLLDSIILLQQ